MGNLSQASTSHGGILHSRWYASTATTMSQPGLNMFENSVYFEFCQVFRQSRIHYSSLYLAMVLGMLANVGFSTRACVAKRATRRGFFAKRWINSWRIISDQLMEQNKALVFESKDPLEAEIGFKHPKDPPDCWVTSLSSPAGLWQTNSGCHAEWSCPLVLGGIRPGVFSFKAET